MTSPRPGRNRGGGFSNLGHITHALDGRVIGHFTVVCRVLVCSFVVEKDHPHLSWQKKMASTHERAVVRIQAPSRVVQWWHAYLRALWTFTNHVDFCFLLSFPVFLLVSLTWIQALKTAIVSIFKQPSSAFVHLKLVFKTCLAMRDYALHMGLMIHGEILNMW